MHLFGASACHKYKTLVSTWIDKTVPGWTMVRILRSRWIKINQSCSLQALFSPSGYWVESPICDKLKLQKRCFASDPSIYLWLCEENAMHACLYRKIYINIYVTCLSLNDKRFTHLPISKRSFTLHHDSIWRSLILCWYWHLLIWWHVKVYFVLKILED